MIRGVVINKLYTICCFLQLLVFLSNSLFKTYSECDRIVAFLLTILQICGNGRDLFYQELEVEIKRMEVEEKRIRHKCAIFEDDEDEAAIQTRNK